MARTQRLLAGLICLGPLACDDAPAVPEADALVAVDAERPVDAARPDAGPPANLLLVIADDLGVDAAPCYADNAAHAPTIEALCARGVVFDNAWANPVCSPTRATILTGLYGRRSGVGDVAGGPNPGIPAELQATLPNLLPDHATACLGKWHLSDADNGGADNPRRMGFDHFAGLLRGALPDYYAWEKTTDGETALVERYATTETVDDAIRWLDARDGPWLLWLAFVAPHTPFHRPPEGLYTGALSDDPAEIRANARVYYDAAIEALDAELGRLIAHLDAETLARTHIVFVGDNGTPPRAVEAPYDRTRAKGTLFEGGVHVPLVVAGPAVVDGGRRTRALANGVDLFATLLDLAGRWEALTPSDYDGRSLAPLLADPDAPAVREWAYSERFGANVDASEGGRTARDLRYKRVRFTDGREALYDLALDPFETSSLLEGALDAEQQAAFDALGAVLDAN